MLRLEWYLLKTLENIETSENIEKARKVLSEGHAAPILRQAAVAAVAAVAAAEKEGRF